MPSVLTARFPLLALLTLLAAAFVACDGDDIGGGDGASPTPEIKAEFGLQIADVASADHPSAMAFLPDGRLLVAEQYTGNILLIGADGTAASEPFAHLDVANWLNQDWGLTGIAVDPSFASNHYVYAFYTELLPSDTARPVAKAKLVRFTESGGKGGDLTTIIDEFPETRLDHQGFKVNGKIHFGPDGLLYMTVGDYDWGKNPDENGQMQAQDTGTTLGKMLRVQSNGDPAPGNPFADEAAADPRVFAVGFALGRDFAFHPTTGKIYGTDSTDSCEEVDIIEAGLNYGWPDVGEFPFNNCTAGSQVPGIHFLAKPGKQVAEFLSPPRTSGMAFVSATKYPAVGDGLLVCGADGAIMKRLALTPPDYTEVSSEDQVVNDCSGPVAISPDGTIYYGNAGKIRKLLAGSGAASS